MRALGILSSLVFLGAPLRAQTADPTSTPATRSMTVIAGIGNSMGWFGLQGERYLGNDRVSLFGGIGYTPAVDHGDAKGVTVAAGIRGYTPGTRHRGFLELSVSQIEVGRHCFTACQRPYGPGLQAGYQYVAHGGFTMSVSAGLGYASGGSADAVGLLGLGFGYTWRR